MQDCVGASVVPVQVSEIIWNCVLSAPMIDVAPRVMFPEPLFVSVMTCGALTVPAATLPKAMEAGLSAVPDPATTVVERDAVLRALAALPERQREVLVLRYYADLSEAAIAEALGVSPGTVKAHASRGLAALRPTLEQVR